MTDVMTRVVQAFRPAAGAFRPAISVIVCTRTRPELVAGCLAALTAQDYPSFELVLVDNTDDAAFAATPSSGRRVRVVRESRPGLSRARNTGVSHARHDVLAFVDDDVIVEPGWLAAIGAAFGDVEVDGLTGLVVPAELETEAQREFEWYGGMGKGQERRLVRGASLPAWRTIGTQAVGVGANMAFRRRVFDRVGPFDEALGAGTVTLGAEDLDMFHRVLRAGLTIRYEPAARVRHRHRRTVRELRGQIFANGCSYSVYLLKIWSARSVRRRDVAAFAAWWLAGRIATGVFRLVARPGIRCAMAWDEVRGALGAPAAYRKAQGLGLKA